VKAFSSENSRAGRLAVRPLTVTSWRSRSMQMPPARSTAGETAARGRRLARMRGQEFLEGERLAQVVVRAEVEPFDPVARAPPGAQHQNRNRRSALPRAFQHLQAILSGSNTRSG
jgi:hypothetical protein